MQLFIYSMQTSSLHLLHFNLAACTRIAFLRTVPTNSKVFLRSLLNIREKQILTGVQKENWG